MENQKCCEKEVCTIIKQYYGCGCDQESMNNLPSIGENGNWFIGETDTGISAKGETGAQGPQGEMGVPGQPGPKGDTGAAGASADMTIVRPDQWVAGNEYSFGGGLYGRRFTGYITESANKVYTKTLVNIGNGQIVESGGWWFNTLNTQMLGTTISNVDGTVHTHSRLVVQETNSSAAKGDVNFISLSAANRNDSPYDIWIKYTK
jgi:hypothetical protein